MLEKQKLNDRTCEAVLHRFHGDEMISDTLCRPLDKVFLSVLSCLEIYNDTCS